MVLNMQKLERLLGKLNKKENGCWEWKSTYLSNGYGLFYWGIVDGKEKTVKASRASWILHNGPILNNLHVLHKCHNRKCCNPEHLYLGTHMDNMRDRDEAGHTSKWDKRYNFKRHNEVTEKVIELRKQRVKIKDICTALNLGRTTVYRCLGIA